ncbi:hypothetical protein GCM10023232_16180 [Sphingosinicella ginsenosidimutans]|uniref:Sec-independent protein translocase protein TatB n=1 Tax=Allosphingosinicella ginsenosidimutans TaxID=1176539 RepID=A0A5C6TR40_9SPHN|nr:Sec-independent protein translocase protein TatB [Sphingosinicella ginsenosidimutans]TXC62686.1 twin-arginine translocase subunit TatB [Sphingosinicella ginsenosidimutans]
MFGIDSGELMVIALVALVVIGPKDLPRVMRTVGHWVGQARGMARHFRSGFDAMIRESELEEMEKKWREDNERIMRMHPPKAPSSPESDWGKGTPAEPAPGKGEGAEGGVAGSPAESGSAGKSPAPADDAPVTTPRSPASSPRRRTVRRAAPPVPRRAAPGAPDRKP